MLKIASRCHRRPGNYRQGDDRSERVPEISTHRERSQEDEGQQRVAEYAYGLVELNVLVVLAHQVYYEVDAQAASYPVAIDRTKMDFTFL